MYSSITLIQVLHGDQLYLKNMYWINLFNQQFDLVNQIFIEHLLSGYIERNKIGKVRVVNKPILGENLF